MIRKTIYERLFDQLTDDPRIKDAEPTPDHNGVNITFTLGEGVWFYTAKEKTLPDGRHLWTGGIYNTPDAANTMPATLAPQTLDKLDADRLHMAVATALGGQVMSTNNKELPTILTIADTMVYLHCSRQHVYDLIKAGRIRTYKVMHRRYIDADSLARIFR